MAILFGREEPFRQSISVKKHYLGKWFRRRGHLLVYLILSRALTAILFSRAKPIKPIMRKISVNNNYLADVLCVSEIKNLICVMSFQSL